MTDKNLTAQAYEYAVKVKRVSKGVIEAYKEAYNKGYSEAKRLPSKELLDIVKNRFETRDKLNMNLAYSGIHRGLNEKEKKIARIREFIESFCDEFEKMVNAT